MGYLTKYLTKFNENYDQLVAELRHYDKDLEFNTHKHSNFSMVEVSLTGNTTITTIDIPDRDGIANYYSSALVLSTPDLNTPDRASIMLVSLQVAAYFVLLNG